ncbi:MAG: ATP-binding protein [Halieaceae bacterium]
MTAVDIAAFLDTPGRSTNDIGLLMDIISSSTDGVLYWEVEPPVDVRAPAKDQIAALLKNLRISYCNSDYAILMGFASVEDLVGRRLEEFLTRVKFEEKICELVDSDYQLTESFIAHEDQHGKRSVHAVLTHCLMRGQQLVGIWNTISDDTERVNREQDLAISRQLLSDSQAMASIGSWSSNLRGVFDFQSEQVAILCGLPPGKLYTFEEIVDCIHPADRDKMLAARTFALTSDETQSVDFRVIHPDGSIHHLRAVARTTFSRNGEPARWLGSMQDVTQDKLLQESRRAQYMDLPDPMFTIELDRPIDTGLEIEQQVRQLVREGRLVDCNTALAVSMDCERNDLMGQPAHFLEDIWTIHGQRFCEDGYRLDKRLIKFEIGPGNDRGRWIQLDASGTLEGKLLTRIWGSFRDVTEQVQVRAQLQEMVKTRTEALSEEVELRRRDAATLRRQAVVVSQISEAVIVRDLDLMVTDWNEGAEQLFGYTRSDMVGQRTTNFRKGHDKPPPEERGSLVKWIEDNDGWSGELVFQHKDGRELVCETSITALRNDSGEIVSLIEVNRDITERKAADAELATARETSEQANHMKSLFIRGLSHELRTPLNAILGFGQLLERIPGQPLVDQQKAYVEHIRAGGEHLLELVNEVLDLAKIEAGEICLCIDRVQPAAVAEECLQMVSPQAQELDIEVHREFLSELTVFADETRLRQVLFNLLSNAVKYNREGGSLTVHIAERDAERLRIAVSDTGEGIAEEQMPALFEPFNRLGVSDVSVQGTGLGLAITEQLVTAMNGNLGVESAVGTGSTFWVDLPIAR